MYYDDEIICPHMVHQGDYCDKCHGDLELQAQDAEENNVFTDSYTNALNSSEKLVAHDFYGHRVIQKSERPDLEDKLQALIDNEIEQEMLTNNHD